MRLVTRNCAMALHRKIDFLAELQPDIAIIQECANPMGLFGDANDFHVSSSLWFGDNPAKGLAIIGFNGVNVVCLSDYSKEDRIIARIGTSIPGLSRLMAVWSHSDRAERKGRLHRGPIHRSLDKALSEDNLDMVVGDFNANAIWDHMGEHNFSNLNSILNGAGLHSIYHCMTGCGFGEEVQPTHYWRDRRNGGSPYHIDYVYVSGELRKRVSGFQIGQHQDWCANGVSDHVPLIVDFAATSHGLP